MTYCEMKIEDIDVLERINAMRSQGDKNPRCRSYLTSLVDASCWKSMVDWCFIGSSDRNILTLSMTISYAIQ